MSSPKDKLSCRYSLVQINESSSWNDMKIELGEIVGTVVGDGVGELGEGADCILGGGAVLCLDEG